MATIEAEVMSGVGAPEPGLYPQVEARKYHQWDAASNSRLGHLLRSPAHLRESVQNPKPPTDEQVFGTACHTLILEPAGFATQFAMADQCAEVTGKGTRCSNSGKEEVEGKWYCGTHLKGKPIGEPDRRIVLVADAWDRAHRVRDAVLAHSAASALLGLPGDREVSVVWRDPATGVLCKGRPDHLAGSSATVADLKTTTDASPEAFTRAIFNFGYHRQAAHYIDGLAECGVTIRHFAIIAVEKTAPYGVAVYRLMDDAVDAGRAQLRTLLETYRQCQERGEWPGYSDAIEDISLPRWAWGSIEMEG